MREFIIPEGYELEKETATEKFGRFVIAPFERGFGHTIGNSLRRILLSSIPGCAVSGVKIEGHPHEFSSIYGVKEDILEIILNLKNLAFDIGVEEKVELLLKTSGKGAVTGENIELPSNVKLANPEQYLFTLDKPKKLEIWIEVTKGVGYVPVELREEPRGYGFIPIDADYSPVKKVAYLVENTRVKRMTNYDKLILEITTDGSISPQDALENGAGILSKCAAVFSPREKSEPEPSEETDVTSLADLGLSKRVVNALSAQNVKTVEALKKIPREKLATFDSLGEKSIAEIEKFLEKIEKGGK